MSVVRLRQGAELLAAAIVLHLVLVQPNHPAAMTWQAPLLVPLELPVSLAALLAVRPGGTAAMGLRATLVAVLVAIAVLKVADYATFVAFDRGFNLAVDLHLVAAGWRLGSGAVGIVPAAAAVAAAIAAMAAVAALIWWSAGRWAAVALPGRWRGVAATVALASGVVAAGEVGQAMGQWRLPLQPPGAAFTARVGVERALAYRDTVAELRAFDAAARRDPFATGAPLLDRIGDRDVVVVFVESYGRASFETPLYASTHRATLAEAEAALAEAGLAMRSGWLTAPMVGGQSWLAHATLASGLWVPDQTRYGALLASERRGLYHLAAEAGFHTAAVMPAITLDWPEAAFMGFETVLPAAALGYRGQPFNWVTMPDQFTLAAVDRLLRDSPEDRPLFAQVALISSHAPWLPIPPMLGWDEIGDGRVYDAWATSGDPPDVVWRDRDRVREQYRRAIDYALRSVAAWALRNADAPPLMVVLGDHQTAPFVSQSASFDVPVHLIGPPELVAQADGWGWTDGLIPAADAPVWRMDAFRDRFLAAFSGRAPALRADVDG